MDSLFAAAMMGRVGAIAMQSLKDNGYHILLLAAGIAAILFFEWHTDEVTVVLAVLILIAGGIGFARPGAWAATGLLLGLSIAAAHALSEATGYFPPAYQTRLPSTGDTIAMVLLIVPAGIAAACGAALRRRLRAA